MAMNAKDGTRHHSASRARLHDEMSANKGGGSKITEMKPPGEGAGAGHPAPSSHSIEDHVDEHGPARKIEYEHDQASGMHHVSSHHGEPPAEGEDGGETSHHSQHKTHHEAHKHMAKAMDMHDEEREERDNESPDQEAMEEAPAGGGIPGLGR